MSDDKMMRPKFTLEEIPDLIQEIYGLKDSAKELSSERDQNFFFKGDSGKEFVVRISNTAERLEVIVLFY